MARALTRKGWSIGVASPDEGPALEAFRALGAKVLVTGPLRSFSLRTAVRLARWFRTIGAVYVYTHSVAVQESLFGVAARCSRCRLIIHRHISAHFSSRPVRRATQKFFWRKALGGAYAVVCVSEQERIQIEHYRLSNVIVVPNGVPIPPASDWVTPKAPLVGFVGRLDPHKGVEEFIRAARSIAFAHDQARFVIVGGGLRGSDYENRCRALVIELELQEKIQFLGPLPDAGPVLASLDIFVLSSILEGHPLALLKAMALGKAVVATDIPACRGTVIDGVNGLLVPPRQPAALAVAVNRLLGSPEERRLLGRAAREHISANFSEARMVEEVLPLFKQWR